MPESRYPSSVIHTTTERLLDRPRQVSIRAIEGPLERLTNPRTFTPVRAKAHVDVVIDLQFKRQLFDHVADKMIHEAAT